MQFRRITHMLHQLSCPELEIHAASGWQIYMSHCPLLPDGSKSWCWSREDKRADQWEVWKKKVSNFLYGETAHWSHKSPLQSSRSQTVGGHTWRLCRKKEEWVEGNVPGRPCWSWPSIFRSCWGQSSSWSTVLRTQRGKNWELGRDVGWICGSWFSSVRMQATIVKRCSTAVE